MIVLRRIVPIDGANIAVARELSGTVNGANKVFTTPHNYKSGRISIQYNGQSLHSPDDFLETGSNQITLISVAPRIDDILRATYEITLV